MRRANPKRCSCRHDMTTKIILQVNELCSITSNNVSQPQYIVVLAELVEIFQRNSSSCRSVLHAQFAENLL